MTDNSSASGPPVNEEMVKDASAILSQADGEYAPETPDKHGDKASKLLGEEEAKAVGSILSCTKTDQEEESPSAVSDSPSPEDSRNPSKVLTTILDTFESVTSSISNEDYPVIADKFFSNLVGKSYCVDHTVDSIKQAVIACVNRTIAEVRGRPTDSDSELTEGASVVFRSGEEISVGDIISKTRKKVCVKDDKGRVFELGIDEVDSISVPDDLLSEIVEGVDIEDVIDKLSEFEE